MTENKNTENCNNTLAENINHYHNSNVSKLQNNSTPIKNGTDNRSDNKSIKDNGSSHNNFYFTIHSFMTSELGLRGSALIVYAIIYAFSYDGKGMFFGSFDFLAEKGGIGLTTAKTTVKQLVEDNLISAVSGEKYKHKEYVINRNKLPPNTYVDLKTKTDLSSRILNAEQSNFERTAVGFGIQGSRILNAEQSDFERNNKYYNKYNNKSIFNSYNSADAQREEKKDLFNKFDFLNGDPDALRRYLASLSNNAEQDDKNQCAENQDANQSSNGDQADKLNASENQSNNNNYDTGPGDNPYIYVPKSYGSDNDENQDGGWKITPLPPEERTSLEKQNKDRKTNSLPAQETIDCEKQNDTHKMNPVSTQKSTGFERKGTRRPPYNSHAKNGKGFTEEESILNFKPKYCSFDPEEAFREALKRTDELFREINEREANSH